ncbi:MAG: CpeR family transcriptional regulator [Synechococcales cyanobacterium RM1_1_8]|nr:CpeR family transcriptional regulator [Synechococcales cyanobacterium RM1_1_8]
MYPIQAEKKLRSWIRSHHLICSGSFYLFETVESSAVDRFSECVEILGGSIISVEPVKKLWIGKHRQVVLFRAKASLHTPEHALRNYWSRYGSFYSRFDERG